MTPKHIAYCLIRNSVTEVGQSSDDPIVTPAWVLFCHLNHQFDDLAVNWWPTWIRALFGTVEFPGDQPAVPGKYRIRFRHTGNLFQSLTAQSLANFGERGSLRV
jgi:hypothetical protein